MFAVASSSLSAVGGLATATAVICTFLAFVARLLWRTTKRFDRLEEQGDVLQRRFDEEIPKNGVALRAALDGGLKKLDKLSVDLTELKATHQAHLDLLHQIPQQRSGEGC